MQYVSYSVVVTLIIGGWITMFAMVGLCALNDCGKLLRIHKRIGRWLETLVPPEIGAPEENPQPAPRMAG